MPTAEETEQSDASIVLSTAPDVASVRQRVETLLEEGDAEQARELLEERTDAPDVSRSTPDNVWLYRTLGRLRRDAGDSDEAIAAYRRAFAFDPRHREVLTSLVELTSAHDREGGVEIFESLLVHARETLDDETLAEVHRRLGALYEARGHSDRARSSYKRAVEYTQSDREALDGILRSLRAEGATFDVMETREHLIEAFDDDAVRAEALLELGDDWRDRFDDAERAMEMYERAADGAQVPDDVYERICEVADELGDDERVYRACSTLARRAEAPETEADWFARAAEVARDRLWESERAIQAFERVLETDPSRFEAFQAITSMLTKSEDWERLEAAYRRAIELNRERDEVDEDLLAVLWFKLGDVHKLHLEQPEEAIEAYREASELFPDNPKFHEAIVDVAESELDDVEAAERHLRALYRLDPDRIEMLERLGRLHLRREEVDAALAHFRAYRALGGELEERAESLLDRVETGMYSSPEGVLDETHRRDFVYPESLDTALNDVFEIIFPVVLDWTSEFRSEYGLERDDFVDPDAKLAFNNIYRDIASDLGYEEAPDLWQSGEYRGLTKAALDDRIVVAGDDLFGSGDEKRIAFAVAKTLFLLEKPFYLLGVLDLSDLQAFFLLALQLVRSDIDFERDEAMEEAFGELERTVTGDQRERLREAIDAATDASDEVDLGRWVEAVEDAANRVGFLFAGDLDVARARLREEAQPFSERDVETRMQTLIEYSLSDDYLTLRDALGLDVS